MASQDLVPVRVEGLNEPVLVPRSFTAEQVQAVIERDILPNLQPPQPAARQAPPMTYGGGMFGGALASDPTGQVARGLGEGGAATGKAVAPMALPAAGAAAGFALGGPLGASAGSLTGEAINQATGITEKSLEALGGAAVAPQVGKLGADVLARGARAVGRVLPGAAAALHEMAASQLAGLADRFKSVPSANDLYQIVDKFAVKVPMNALRAATKNLLSDEQVVAEGLKLDNVAQTAGAFRKDLAGKAAQTVETGLVDSYGKALTREVAAATEGGVMDFQAVRQNLKRIGDKVRETRMAGGEEHGAWKQMWKAAMTDLEDAAAQGNPALPAVQALKAATTAAKREFAAEDIADLFNLNSKAAAVTVRGDGLVQVNFAKALKEIRTSEDLKRSLTPDEYKALLTDVQQMAKNTPTLPAQPGQNAGSYRKLASTAIGTGVGGVAGYMVGNTTLGATTGGALGAALPDAIGKLMVSDTGRRFLMGVLAGTGHVITPQAAILLSTVAGTSPAGRQGAVQIGDLGRSLMQGNP